jgi:CRISPR system Cascade subunit CasB
VTPTPIAPDSATAPEQTDPPATLRRRRRRPFGDHVAAEVARLQHALNEQAPWAVAITARLRAAVARPPADAYDVAEITAVPPHLLGYPAGTEPADRFTETERAKHTALTLYAVHQQSRREHPMHRDGPSVGEAVSLLAKAKATSNPEPIRRRFIALGTATSYDELVHHLRGLIRLLRDANIGLDYGLLADDLAQQQRPGGPDRIRSTWGRDYYRAWATQHPADSASDSFATDNEQQ